MEQLTFLSEAHPVSPSALQGREKVLKTIEETWHSPSAESQTSSNQTGLSGRTSQVSSQAGTTPSDAFWQSFQEQVEPSFQTEDGTTQAWSLGRNAKLHGVFSMLSSSEYPREEKESSSSLLQILETSDPQKRYSLSPKACVGILRRAVNRGKTLPPLLEDALLQTIGREDHTQL